MSIKFSISERVLCTYIPGIVIAVFTSMLMAHTYLMLMYWPYIWNLVWMYVMFFHMSLLHMITFCSIQLKVRWLKPLEWDCWICFCRWWTYCKPTLTLGWWCRSRMPEQRKTSGNTIRCWSVWSWMIACAYCHAVALMCHYYCVGHYIHTCVYSLLSWRTSESVYLHRRSAWMAPILNFSWLAYHTTNVKATTQVDLPIDKFVLVDFSTVVSLC